MPEKKLDESLRLLDNVILRDPANIEARLLQAQVWLAQGEVKKAIESLESSRHSYPKASADQISTWRAPICRITMRPRPSFVLNQVLAASPNNVEALLLLSEINLRNGKAQQVVTAMLDFLKQRPDLIPAQIMLAQAYQSLGRLDDAAAIFREQIKVLPSKLPAHLSWDSVLRQQDKLDEARKAIETAQPVGTENLLAVSQLVDLDIQARTMMSPFNVIKRTPENAAFAGCLLPRRQSLCGSG